MKFYAHEIDGHTASNTQFIEKWQENYGSIYPKLQKCTCINCEKPTQEYDYMQYVACHNGKLLMWHTQCKRN